MQAIETMIDSVNTFTDNEIEFVKTAFHNVVGTTQSADLAISEIAEASRILKKPEWIALLFSTLSDHGICIERGTPYAFKLANEAWQGYGRLPADHAAESIANMVKGELC